MDRTRKLTSAQKLGAAIRTARAPLSQEQLAELIGTAQPVISRYERGTAVPSSHHLAALIHHLHLDAGDVYDLVHRHFEDKRRAERGAA